MEYSVVKDNVSEQQESTPISIGGVINRTVNFAMQQNKISAIHNIVLTEKQGKTYQDLKVEVSFEPKFAEDFCIPVSRLEAFGKVEIKPVEIHVITDYLLGLTEKILGTITIRCIDREEELGVRREDIELLTYDQWSGSVFMPELLSAFVLPNHPEVIRVVNKAGSYLQKWSNDPSFMAYVQQDPDSVRMQVGAIYAALQEENIAYALPPASFENIGQKIRLADAVFAQRMGTCLDLTVLFAGCLESVGLHPILVIMKGHAFVGCWVSNKTFLECIQDDISALLKRTAEGIDELLLVETTLLVAGKNVGFDAAVQAGRDNLGKEEEFCYAVDVARCRSSNIRPIPTRIIENGVVKMVDYGTDSSSHTSEAPQSFSTIGRGATVAENEMTKQQLWERKLLDLSLRNALLSFRPTQNSLQLMMISPALLEDELSKGTAFGIYACPSDLTLPKKEGFFYTTDEIKELAQNLVSTEFSNTRIRTFVDDKQLETAMKGLSRKAKLSLEENGSNQMYLALGFLKWYETEESKKERYAPLILVPVDVQKKIMDKAYQIKIRDEEAQINITLLEMLRQDFQMDIGGLDPLPADESGIDIPLIFNIIRQGIMDKTRWDVLEACCLSLFSFSRFIMWNDIRSRREDMMNSKVVSSLIEGKLTFEPVEEAWNVEDMDADVRPSDMAVPVSADSSQLAAIHAAAKGESFVLHGPPGTGKSQTITNMIANALYQGKSVLFVAEKMAALTVVKNRLDRIGLSPFCLELHSNKAQKRSVLAQLDKTLETGKYAEPQDYEAKSAKLYELRQSLDAVVTQIHKKQPCGKSLYELLSLYEGLNIFQGKLTLSAEITEAINQNGWDGMLESIGMYRVVASEMGRNHPLRAFVLQDYSIEIREALASDLKHYIEELTEEDGAVRGLETVFGVKLEETAETLNFFDRLFVMLKQMNGILPILLSDQLATQADSYKNLLVTGAKRQGMRAKLLQDFKESVFTYDVISAQNRWAQAEAKWALAKMSDRKALVKELQFFANNPKVVDENNILGVYNLLSEYAKVNSYLMNNQQVLIQLFGPMYRNDETDYSVLGATLDKHLELGNFLRQSTIDAGVIKQVKDTLCAHPGGLNDLLSANPQILSRYEAARARCLTTENKLMQTYAMQWNAFTGCKPMISKIREQMSAALSKIDDLRLQAAYSKASAVLAQQNLSEIPEAFESGALQPEELESAFLCNVGKTLSLRIISSNDVLKQFTGAGFDETIARYRDVLQEFDVLTMRELAAKLSVGINRTGKEFAQSSELGILQKAIKSNGRMMSIRKLFDTIPLLLRRLCPCMLMSPISVAQYLSPKYPKFDLVIFDEASQLPTGEAIGSLIRAENAIVVGDPKQLPPTSFFMAGKGIEDDFEVADMESLLDDCLTLSMQQMHLRWHYRSRHESLIAYSNMTYYDNKLYTFPSPNDLVSQVKWIPVEGVYDRGKTKQNKAEAELIVQEVVRRLSDEELRKDSIGVVTFSSVQQELIEDMLTDAFREHPELEQINNEAKEPLFVKNLENVQGDERDVILFSVCYGPDMYGKVSMNFGPLNQSGGWRRLNVAITRSRKEMQIYSTLRPDQIPIQRTSAEGVMGLKGFLEFAIGGKNMLAVRNSSIVKRNTDLIASIADEVSMLGYEVRTNIGSSEFKVDIGVVNPNEPDQYCLGILCDGENYSMAQNARDRNVLQPDMLKSLGWKLHRVWILDWLDSPGRELDRIAAAIDKALSGEEEAEEEKVEEAIEFVKEDSSAADLQSGKSVYRACTLPILGDAEDFYQEKTKMQIEKCIEKVMQAEAPICRKLLEKRVLGAWNILRMSSKTEEVFEVILREIPIQQTQTHGVPFYWLESMDPMNYPVYRLSDGKPENARNFDEICSEEISVAIRDIVKEQISLSREDVVRETAKKFGYTRVGAVIDTVVGISISQAEQRGFVEVSDDGMQVKSKI